MTTIHAKSIEICGAQTEFCVDATVKFAHGLGYQLRMYEKMTTTRDSAYMTAEQTIAFYEDIWKNRFVTILD